MGKSLHFGAAVMQKLPNAFACDALIHNTYQPMKSFTKIGASLIATCFLCGLGIQAQEAAAPESAAAEAADASSAEEMQMNALVKSINWVKEKSGAVGTKATIKIPDGYVYTEAQGTKTLMRAFGNLVNEQELGFISPEDLGWFAVFEFQESGYVKDDDKDKLDADEMMKQMIKDQKSANAELKNQGMASLELLGWHTKPFYNAQTNNLEWAIRLRSEDGGETINYKTKLLGRRGVMDVVLVCSENELDTVIPKYQELLTGFAYASDENYASYRKGDKVAEYGLAGLIVGGGLLAAAKSGLLTKLIKPIGIALVAAFVWIKRLFSRKSNV